MELVEVLANIAMDITANIAADVVADITDKMELKAQVEIQ